MHRCRNLARLGAACILSLNLAIAHAAAETPAAIRALSARLVTSQHLDTYWQPTLENAKAKSIDEVKRGARAALEARMNLSDAERARADGIIDELAPQIAAAVDAAHRRADVHALVTDMVATVFTQHFSVAELEQMATFYDSPAFQKSLSLGMKVDAESKRTGVPVAELWHRHDSEFTDEERAQLAQFSRSAVGQKQRSLNSTLRKECTAFLEARLAADVDRALAPYQDIVRKRLQTSP
jgi:hypothetical protein